MLESIFREAGARIIAALAARFHDLDIAEDAFAEACLRAAEQWRPSNTPANPAGWLYQVALHCAADALRRRRPTADVPDDLADTDPTPEERVVDAAPIPDERLRLIFVCCHPAVAPEARAALTLRLVCGLSMPEIARAFLISEPAMAQRLTRAKRKIALSGVPFEVPGPEGWTERLDAVLSTIDVAYSKAHEDAAGTGRHADLAAEVLTMTRTLAELLPNDPEVLAGAAIVRYAQARRPARLASDGSMVPLSHQNPALWDTALIAEGNRYQARAVVLNTLSARVVQAGIQGVWCRRRSLDDPPPWPAVLALYDRLVGLRDDPIVRLNRAVALAEIEGPQSALDEVDCLDGPALAQFLPYHAVRADLLRRLNRAAEAVSAYDAALALGPGSAERSWLLRQRREMGITDI